MTIIQKKSVINSKNMFYLGIFLMIGLGFWIRISNYFHTGFNFDTVYCFYSWGKSAYENGFRHFWQYYDRWMDYIPGSIYYLMGIYKISLLGGGTDVAFVATLKIVNTVFEIIICGLVYLLAQRRELSRLTSLFYASLFWILPANWFISAIWGQIEPVVMVFAMVSILSIYVGFQNHSARMMILAGIACAVAFWLKLQTVLFFPLIGLAFMINGQFSLLKKFTLAFLITSLLIAFPALISNPLRLGMNLIAPFTRDDRLSRSASDFWVLINHNLPATEQIFKSIPVTYGILATGIFIIIFSGTLLLIAKKIQRKDFPLTDALLLGSVYLFAYFIFMAKMYERYLYPGLVVLFFLLPLIKSKNIRILILSVIFISEVGSFLNILDVYHYWNYTKPAWLISFWKILPFNVYRVAAALLFVSFILLVESYYLMATEKKRKLGQLLRTESPQINLPSK